MSKDWYKGKTGTFGEDLGKSPGPEKDEGCNAYYNRKQRTKDNDVGPDVETDYAPEDRDAEASNYKSDRDAGPMNTPWTKDFYGRNR